MPPVRQTRGPIGALFFDSLRRRKTTSVLAGTSIADVRRLLIWNLPFTNCYYYHQDKVAKTALLLVAVYIVTWIPNLVPRPC